MKESENERRIPKVLVSDPKKRLGRGVFSNRALILMLLIFILLIGVFLVLILPSFYVKEIVITGTKEVSNEQLISAMGLEMDDHLFSNIGGGFIQVIGLRYGEIEDELSAKFPYIESVEVRFALPSKVTVEVTERQKIAYVDLPDGYAVVDRKGTVVEIEPMTDHPNVPLMLGLPVNSVRLGEKIVMDNQDGFDLCIVVFGAVIDADQSNVADKDFQLMKCVRSVRYVDSKTIFLTVDLPESARSIAVKIGGLKNLKDDMNWLRHALSTNAFDDMQGTLLDMAGTQYSLR